MATPQVEIEALTDLTVASIRDLAVSISGTGGHKNANVVSILNTTAKDLAGAINELNAALGNVVMIDDTAPSATSTFSSNKINADRAADIAAALEGEDLSDLAAAVAANAQADSGLLNFTAAQTLTAEEQVQGQTNLGLGDLTNLDLVNRYNTARDA